MVLLTLAVSGCSFYDSQPEILKSYPYKTAPSQTIRTEKHWVMLNSAYADTDYTISFTDDLKTEKSVYSVSQVSIWYIDANDTGIFWCEKSDDFYTYKLYEFETCEIGEIFRASVSDGFQPQNVGIFLKKAYYCAIDYEMQTVSVLVYDTEAKTSSVYYSEKYMEEKQPYLINLKDEYLSFSCSRHVIVFDLRSGDTVFESVLPESINYLFCVSYGIINDECALYFADNDSESIGILKKGENSILSVFTFAENHYAFHDVIEYRNGHIYWIDQANVSGAVSDHYRFIDYDVKKRKPTETYRTFDFCFAGNDMFILRFNKSGDYTHIDLCRYVRRIRLLGII
jgi:hypothetical protein